MQRASRHDLVRALAPPWAHAGKREKGQVLDELCQVTVTGYTRKHAFALRSTHPKARRRPAEAPTAR